MLPQISSNSSRDRHNPVQPFFFPADISLKKVEDVLAVHYRPRYPDLTYYIEGNLLAVKQGEQEVITVQCEGDYYVMHLLPEYLFDFSLLPKLCPKQPNRPHEKPNPSSRL